MSKLWQATVGMIIYLGRLLPAASSNLPKAGGPRQRFCSVLLRMGFTYALSVTRETVVSYTALPPLPGIYRAVYFCCTILRVASTGRYPASCPVKPGLSSSAIFRFPQPRLSVLLNTVKNCTMIFPKSPVLHPQSMYSHLLLLLQAHHIVHSVDVHRVL